MRKESGFTLVELSIVLVIIGLIVSGVVAGGSLVTQAKLRALGADIEKYKVAINTFKLQYDALPGDMSNATSYWPSCVDVGSNVCNGNGDKMIYDYEVARVFQHLGYAGLVAGSYDRQSAAGNIYPGENVGKPPLKGNVTLGNALTGIFYYMKKNDNDYGPNKGKNALMIATWGFGQVAVGNDMCTGSNLKSAWAYNLDVKYDDGAQYTGKVISPSYSCGSGGGACNLASPAAATETYGCVMSFRTDF